MIYLLACIFFQDLLGTLETNVETHNEFCVKCQELRDWIDSEKEKHNQCDDCTGEKSDLSKRLEIVKVSQLINMLNFLLLAKSDPIHIPTLMKIYFVLNLRDNSLKG